MCRPWRQKRLREAQSSRPVASFSDPEEEEEETPLLLEVAAPADIAEADVQSKVPCSQTFAKVCFALSLATALAAVAVVIWLPAPLGQYLHILGQVKLGIGLQKLIPGPCFAQRMGKIMQWMIEACKEHLAQLSLCFILLPASFALKMCIASSAKWLVQRLAGEEHVEQIFRKGEVAQTSLFWLADMLSDMYVTYKYCKQKMFGFAFLMISTWLGSGCAAFGHRYVSWERCKHRFDYWAAGLNERGEPPPGFTTFLLYISQIQPMIMAWDSWQRGGMDRFLQEEKMLTALTEGAPSSLLQLYAMLLDPPKDDSLNLLIFCGSIALSIYTVAESVNKAFELCRPDRKVEQGIPNMAMLGFRWWDAFSRIGVWALLGVCLRPQGAKLHGIQQPYLPVVMVGELLLIAAAFKSQSFGLNLPWPKLLKKEYLVSLMGSFLGIYWCCNDTELKAQHRFFRSLLVLRLFETLGAVWLSAVAYSTSLGCLATEQPAVVIVVLLVLVSSALTFIVALAHDLAMSTFAVPLFPVIAGEQGGRLELAARFGVAWRIRGLLQAGADDGVAALCEAAKAGQVSVIHALLDEGITADATWRGKNAFHWAAIGGQVPAIQAVQPRGKTDLERADEDGGTPALLAAQNGHLDVLKFLQSAGCNLERAKNNGSTPALVAAGNGHVDVSKLLHGAGCSLERANINGWTPALFAAHKGHVEVLKFLHSTGCHIGAQSLQLATAGDHLSVVQFLLGIVDVNAAALGGARALDVAVAMDPNSPVTDALLKAGAMPGPKPQLIGLTALKPAEPPPHGFRWFTCGAPDMAQSRGQFYHEIELLSDFETTQLGWLSSDFQGGDEDGNGVGDDPHSWAFDGQRLGWWHNGEKEPLQISPWKVGDVLGFAIDLDKGEMQLRTKQEELTMPFQVSGAM